MTFPLGINIKIRRKGGRGRELGLWSEGDRKKGRERRSNLYMKLKFQRHCCFVFKSFYAIKAVVSQAVKCFKLQSYLPRMHNK